MKKPLKSLWMLSFLSIGILGWENFSTVQAQSIDPKTVDLIESQLPDQPAFIPGEVIVKLKPSRSLDSGVREMMGVQAEARRTSGGEFIFKIPGAETMNRNAMATASIQKQTLDVVKNFNERDDVLYAQPNYIYKPVKTPNDPGYSQQWHYRNNGGGPNESPGGINLPKQWDITNGSPSVVVAIIDTGILPNHEDIVGSPNLVPGYDMISDPFTAHDGDGRDVDPTDPGDAVAPGECSPTDPGGGDSWHGTHVAGTVGVGHTDNGVGVAGVSWQTKVQAVRVLGKCGGTTADIVDAIRWAAGLSVPGAPSNSTPARVINMSLGGQPGFPCSGDPATQGAINDAVGAGTVVVVAAGNDAVDAATVSPASCENVITVAASDYRGHLASRYSNFGQTIEIMAPGGDVRRDDNSDGKPDGVLSMVKGGYAYYNGTSMAAPHVSGVAALYMAEDPEMQLPGQVLARLKNDAILRTSTECPNPCGAGLLSAFKKDGPKNGDKELKVIPALPPPTEDSIDQGGEKDWFTFSVATQGQHKIETYGGTDVKIALFGPGNKTTKIANDDDSGQGYNAKISTLLAPGLYFVQVEHFSPTGTGNYSIAVQAE